MPQVLYKFFEMQICIVLNGVLANLCFGGEMRGRHISPEFLFKE